MIKARRILSVCSGTAPLDLWEVALEQESRVYGDPLACATCPLRVGGEWEAGIIAVRPEMTPQLKLRFGARWGCHSYNRPCAGMRRLMEVVGE